MPFASNPITCNYCCGRMPQRVVLTLMMHFALENSYCLRVVLNLAIVEMVEPEVKNKTISDACPQFPLIEAARKGGKFHWPQKTRSEVLYAFFVGYLFTGIPGGWIADKFGGRGILGVCIFLSALSTVVFPFLTQQYGYIMAVVLRGLLGLAQGPVLPVISSFVSTWIPKNERTILGGICYGGSNLGTIIGGSVTGLIIHESEGWPAAFYLWSCVSFVYVLIYFVYVYSYPATHPYITDNEVKYITDNVPIKRQLKTPWIAILTNVPYWANIAAQFGHNYIFFIMVTWLPTYMKEVLRFDIKANGLLSVLPFLALWLSSLVLSCTGNYLVHGMNFMSPNTFSKVFASASNVASAALVLGAVYAGCNRTLCITLYVLGMIVKAFYYVTLPVNINELSKNHGGTLYGICNSVFGGISGIIGSWIIGYFTKDNKLSQWRLAFWITLGIEVATSIIYFFFSSSDRQPFDYEEGEEIPA